MPEKSAAFNSVVSFIVGLIRLLGLLIKFLFIGYLLLTPVFLNFIISPPKVTKTCFPELELAFQFVYLFVSLFPVAFFLGLLIHVIGTGLSLRFDGPAPKQASEEVSKLPPQKRRNIMALGNFIINSRKTGIPGDQITRELKIAGWSEDEIRKAFELENARA